MIRRLLIFALSASTLLASELPAAKSQPRFSYRREELPEGPWSIHIIKIDRANPNVELQTTLPPGRRFGLAKLSEQVKAFHLENARPLAAINGDYYEVQEPYLGDPKGLQIMRGELISAPSDWTCFWINPGGAPAMGKVEARFDVTLPDGSRFPFGLNQNRSADQAVIYTSVVGANTMTRGGIEFVLEQSGSKPWLPLRASADYFGRVVQINESANSPTATNQLILSIGPRLLGRISRPVVGDVVRVTTRTTPALKGVRTALGGGPALVQQGKPAARNEARVRHPRSAIGWNKQFIFLVEVDGRQPDLSVGMTFEELAGYLVKLGCHDAMGLDGGGSATVWVGGQIMNNPCEGGERGMANGLVLLSKEVSKE